MSVRAGRRDATRCLKLGCSPKVALVGRGSAADRTRQPICSASSTMIPLRAADVAEPVAVLIALQLADELRAAGSQAGDDGVDVFDGECDVAIPGVLAGACRLSPWFDGEWNFASLHLDYRSFAITFREPIG